MDKAFKIENLYLGMFQAYEGNIIYWYYISDGEKKYTTQTILHIIQIVMYVI